MPELITVEQAERLDTTELHELYARYISKSQVSLIGTFGFGRDLVDSAEGCWIRLQDGRRVLDFTGGIGVLNHGHNHPRILKARQRFQEHKRLEVHKNFLSPYAAALAHNLAALLPGDLNIGYFPSSGSEAVEGAVKMAYKYHEGRRGTVLHADTSFHGKLLGAGSLTGSPELHFHYPKIPGTDSFAFGDIESLRLALSRHETAATGSDVYAVIVEPYSASSLRASPEYFLREARRLCDERDIVLIFDEVYTGWGKTGSLFYFMRYPGLVPDILTTSKSFGGGKSSISGYVAREPVFRKAYDNLSDATLHSTTYFGFGEEAATALEAVAITVEDDYPARATAIGEQLERGLRAIAAKHPKLVDRVEGVGALHGVFLSAGSTALDAVLKRLPSSFARDPQVRSKIVTAAVVGALYRDHDILSFYGSNREIALIVSPSLVTGEEEVERFLSALDDVLGKGLTALVAGLVREKVMS
ncbi:aspartate aminotransferase family protein [Amycolatopsis sp. NPDC059021]|uniref:aspartate aminotransferase family protein n=1 Tax=Amycolatopsis sp. NPDC059021 TaxID=3346704 RepID=UPI00366FF8C6